MLKLFNENYFIDINEKVSIPIKVEDSVPKKFLDILENCDDQLLELLLKYNSMVDHLEDKRRSIIY